MIAEKRKLFCSFSDAEVIALQVAFHLQMQQPPILPPLCALFQQSPDVLKGRPLHAGQQAREGVLEVNPSLKQSSNLVLSAEARTVNRWTTSV